MSSARAGGAAVIVSDCSACSGSHCLTESVHCRHCRSKSFSVKWCVHILFKMINSYRENWNLKFQTFLTLLNCPSYIFFPNWHCHLRFKREIIYLCLWLWLCLCISTIWITQHMCLLFNIMSTNSSTINNCCVSWYSFSFGNDCFLNANYNHDLIQFSMLGGSINMYWYSCFATCYLCLVVARRVVCTERAGVPRSVAVSPPTVPVSLATAVVPSHW